jgi:type I restriction enzyme R subunit
VPQLFAFLQSTQPEAFEKLRITYGSGATDSNRLKFLTQLSTEVGKRGVIDVLRKGADHGPIHFDLFYGTPSEGNARAAVLHAENRFSITRQLAYSANQTRRALDLCLFINGLPIATFELKNSLTKQTVEDAVEQYRRDRDPREKLFEFGRCVVHYAVDDTEVRMCTELAGKGSWFLPFNQGYNDGAGNPPNPAGLKTEYLWKEMLTGASWMTRFRGPSGSSCRCARQWAMRSARATSAGSSSRARRSSFRRCRSSPSSWTRSRPRGAELSPSSSTRRPPRAWRTTKRSARRCSFS